MDIERVHFQKELLLLLIDLYLGLLLFCFLTEKQKQELLKQVVKKNLIIHGALNGVFLSPRRN